MARRLTLVEAAVLLSATERARPGAADATTELVSLVALLRSDGVDRSEILDAARLDPGDFRHLTSTSAHKSAILIDRHGEPLAVPKSLTGEHFATSSLQAHPELNSVVDSILLSQGYIAEETDWLGTPTAMQRDVVLLLGDQGERRLDLESSELRTTIPNSLWRFQCEPGAQVADIRDLLDALRPSILHLTAHADKEGVHLVANGRRSIVAWSEVLAEIDNSVHRPPLVILNACYSVGAAEDLRSMGVPFVLSVDGRVPVDCAREYIVELYRSLSSFDLHRSKERADSRIKPKWSSVRYDLNSSTTGPWYAPWALIRR